MPEYKSHHYVPQMYLRLFSGREAGRVGVFVMKSGKFIRGAQIKGQLCHDYFYGRDKRAEKAFSSTGSNCDVNSVRTQVFSDRL